MTTFWVIEFNGVPQWGSTERCEAVEKAEQNLGATLDWNGETYKVRGYVPSLVPPISRAEALKLEGIE